MAISNFTNFFPASVFSIFSSRPKHEKNSCSLVQKSPELFVSFANSSALSMMSRTYKFRYKDDSMHSFSGFFVATVSAVVVNSSGSPEILLASGSDDPNYFSLDNLVVLHEVIVIN